MNNLKEQKINLSKSVPKLPLSILITGKILQFISPHLATKFAVKLFQTPIKFKTPACEKMMAESAQLELVEIPELNKHVMVYHYGFSDRKVLLVHGWAGRGTQLYSIADKLLEKGMMTISFDAPAHGKSTGNTTMMHEFVTTIIYLNKKYGPFEIAIGHSLGGMAVLNSMNRGVHFKKAVSIGAGNVISTIISDFVNKIKFKPEYTNRIKQVFYKKFKEDIDNYSTSIIAKNIKIPTLIIHDTEDLDVDVSCAHNIRQNLQKGELLIKNGLGHRRILKDNQVIDRIIDFINQT